MQAPLGAFMTAGVGAHAKLSCGADLVSCQCMCRVSCWYFAANAL